MTTNVDIGQRLQAERQRLGLTQAALSQLGQVSKTTQVNYETGFRMPDALYLSRIASSGVDVLFVVTGMQAEEPHRLADLVPIRRFDVQASAGYGAIVQDQQAEYEVDALSVSASWLMKRRLSPSQLRLLHVRGNSMQGVLADGDLVLVDQSDITPRSGFVYLLRQGDELLVKYCEQLPGGVLRISSANPAFRPYDVDLSKAVDVAVLGRVVASMHDW